MQGFKNLIARRRPTAPLGNIEAPEATAIPQADPDATPGDAIDARDMARAKAGRAHVPRPEALAHQPFRPTMGEKRMPTTPPRDERAADHPARPTPAPKIWDIEPPAAPVAAPEQDGAARPAATDDAESILARCAADPRAAPSSGRATSQRAKTRLLGFHDDSGPGDVFAAEPVAASAAAPRFPIGWIVVLDGPGRGASFTLTTGLSTIGRDADQTITLDFGDTAISRQNHVAIAHDDEENRTYVGHGGKSNIVRHNDQPLLTTETLTDGDTIRIGKTVLRFVALCDDDFSWTEQGDD